MKKTIFILPLLFMFGLQAQVLTLSRLKSMDEIRLDSSGKITIEGLSGPEQKSLSIIDETGTSIFAGKKSGKLFVFDLHDTLTKTPSANLMLASTVFGFRIPLVRAKTSTPLTRTASAVRSRAGKSPTDISDVYTGIAFWDATSIYNLAVSDPCNEAMKTKFLATARQYSNNEKLRWEDLKNNPFFMRIAGLRCIDTSLLEQSFRENIASTESGGALLTGAIGAISGLDVTKFVQAFADFLKERIKAELTIAYVEKLKTTLQNTPELKYLLPKTYHVFTTSDIYSIPSMGVIYKSAFAEDLDNLVQNFEAMVYQLPAYTSIKESAGFKSFLLAYHYSDLSARGYHPADILMNLDMRYGFQKDSVSALSYHLSLINMLSSNLRDTSASEGWINKGDLKLKNKNFTNIFFGLLYEKYPALFHHRANGGTLLSTLIEARDNTEKTSELLVVANNIDARIKAFKSMTSAEQKDNVLAIFKNNADEILELFDFSFESAKHQLSQEPDYVKWKNIMRSTIEVVKGIKENNTGKVSINSLQLISTLLPVNDQSTRIVGQLTEFTKFISDMVEAKNAKDIKLVLDRYSAPISSYRAARTSRFSAALTSYPGLYVGVESNRKGHTTDKTFGITAPLGFSFNWGTHDSSSIGLYINLVDIGAALSFRWNNDSTDLPKKIVLGQIFSPGAFVVYGFRNSPLALKAGLQYAPQLRSIRAGQNIINEVSVVRYTVGLSVDIPIFIFSRQSRFSSTAHSSMR